MLYFSKSVTLKNNRKTLNSHKEFQIFTAVKIHTESFGLRHQEICCVPTFQRDIPCPFPRQKYRDKRFL
jgi:hypothetical protein